MFFHRKLILTGRESALPSASTGRGKFMRFRLLGPVEAWDDNDGARIEVRGSKMRTVLASLLLSSGRVVSDARLIDMLWGEEPPSTTQAQIQTYASRLRGLLGTEVQIERQPPGYRLTVSPRPFQLDLMEFERLAAQGHLALAAGEMTTAVGLLRTALSLWRGQALTGVTDHLAAVEQPRLEEARLTALEDRIEADLALGEHVTLITELTALVAEHPLRERPRAQLMLALVRCGRTADALAAYQAFRRILADELGLDPSAELRQLHQSILTGDPALAIPAAPGRTKLVALSPVLPPEPGDFTGRTDEAAQVCSRLTAPGPHNGPPDVCVITGMGGVGKTTLALHVARRLREQFSDRQIRVDLGGSHLRPPNSQAILAHLLTKLGVEEPAIPNAFEDMITLYRGTLAGTRTLLLLDDAEGERQVRPLLPGVAGCGVLVTSRTRLTALDRIHRTELDAFSAAEALELLAHIAGPERTKAEEPAARRIADLCDHLPLAIRISGARLAARPHWPLARLADRLADVDHLLDELRLADLDVRANMAPSYRSLRSEVRQGMLMLARLGSASFSVPIVAELLELAQRDAQDLVEELVEAHLLTVDPREPDCYRFPNLVRAFAAHQTNIEKLNPPSPHDLPIWKGVEPAGQPIMQ
jgi:DNA-binding SARP family transcriptional activator